MIATSEKPTRDQSLSAQEQATEAGKAAAFILRLSSKPLMTIIELDVVNIELETRSLESIRISTN